MANHPVKYNRHQHNTDTWKNNWEVMKPFVYFGFKAMVLVGRAMISIIKLLPTLLQHPDETPKKESRIIKI